MNSYRLNNYMSQNTEFSPEHVLIKWARCINVSLFFVYQIPTPPPPTRFSFMTANPNHDNDSIKLAFKLLFIFLAIFSWIWVQDYLGKNIKSLYLANFYSWRRHLLYFLKETQLISFLANHPSPDIITQSNQNLSTSEPDSKFWVELMDGLYRKER